MLQRRRPAATNEKKEASKGDKKTAQGYSFYNSDTVGVPIPPVMVVSGSLIFIGVVFVLHAVSKIMA